MNKKSLVVSYNDLADDIAKPYFLYKSLKKTSFKPYFLINESKKKSAFLNFHGAKYITFKILTISNVFYLILGLFVSFLASYKIKKEFEDIAFKSFCISAKNRVGGLRLISSRKLNYLRLKFLIVKIIVKGFLFIKFSFHKSVDNVILDERHKLPESIIYYLAIGNNIPVTQYTRGPYQNSLGIKKLFLKNWWHHPLSDSKAILNQKIDDSNFPNDWEKKLLNEISKRYERNHWYDRNLIVGAKNKQSFKKLFHKDIEDYVLIVPHIFWDATFSYGESIFEDYLSWLVEVLNLASKTNLKYICKLHPDLEWKSKRLMKGFDHLDFISKKVSEFKADNVRILSPETEISPLSLIKNAKAVLTVRGTAGLEAACFGVPTMTAGSGRYSSFGFTINSSSKEEFEKNFLEIKNLKSLSNDQIENARKLAFKIFFQKPLILNSLNLARDLSKDMSMDSLLESFQEDSFEGDYKKYKFHDFFKEEIFDIYST